VRRRSRIGRILIGASAVGGAVGLALLAAKAREPGQVDPPSFIEPEDSPSRRVIARDDLPPEGTRSLFDHLLAGNGGLPYPFEKLVDLVARYDAEARRPPAVLIPDGRSLLKAQATVAKPRIVVAADGIPPPSDTDLGFILRGRLFLGYVEDAREIEVISYNESAGRYEFQLVRDYAEGAVPRITYAKRSLCASCHQGEAPIFPVRPWDETNAQPDIARKIAEARGAASADYFGVPITEKLATAERIDDLVTLANTVVATERAWIDGCGADGVECRRQMLRVALRILDRPADVAAGVPATQTLVDLQRRSWPRSGIPIANSSILNRNPFVDRSSGEGILARLEKLFIREPPRSADDLGRLAPVRPELDPLRPRRPRAILDADSLDGAYGVAALFAPADRRLLEKAAGGDSAKLEGAVASEKVVPLLGTSPFRRSAVVTALAGALGVEPLPKSAVETTAGMSPPLAEGGKPLKIAAGSPLEPFERYCFACHRGNPAARLDFMSGESEEEVLGKLKQVSEIREVLDYDRYLGTKKESKLMPPANSYQRRDLDRARAAGAKDVERMIAVVPGLFE